MHDPDDPRRMHPRLPVHLHRDALLAQDPDDDAPALGDAVTLEVHQAGGAHVHGAEHGNDLKYYVFFVFDPCQWLKMSKVHVHDLSENWKKKHMMFSRTL